MKCSNCGADHEREGQRLCCECHAAYMREWRKTHHLNEAHQQRDRARSTAFYYRRRGKLIPQPCSTCGDPNVEMHHLDHERPLDVTWLCRPCHLAWHAFWRSIVLSVFDSWVTAERSKRDRAKAA